MDEASSVGVEATPVVFLDGMKMDGAVPEDELRMALDKELQAVGVAAPAKPVPAPGH
jgi:protein-disulfide isomerase